MTFSRSSIIKKGIEKAFPNMIYGNALFTCSLVLRSLLLSDDILNNNNNLEGYLYYVVAFAILFFAGMVIAILPATLGGAILALSLQKEKNTISTKSGVGRGAFVGCIGMSIICTFIYTAYRPHGVPDPSFVLNGGTAIVIATFAGALTGLQLTKELLKASNE